MADVAPTPPPVPSDPADECRERLAHRVELGDDGMIHCRTCGRSWWPQDPGRTLPDDICAADPVVSAMPPVVCDCDYCRGVPGAVFEP
jgi:hypothetical protein